MMVAMDVNPPPESPRHRYREAASLSERARWMFTMLVKRLLVSGRGEVHALEQAIHLQERLVVLVVVFATVVPSLLLLAYFAFSAIESTEFDVASRDKAERVAVRFREQLDSDFQPFEDAVRRRLEAGRSPLENLRDLHPLLLVALQLDASGKLIGPFQTEEGGAYDESSYLFEGPYQAAAEARAQGASAETVADLFEIAARRGGGRAARGRAAYDAAVALGVSGQTEEALSGLDRVATEYATTRDPWGFRLGDLARLSHAELILASDPEAGREAVRGLVEDLITTPWTVAWDPNADPGHQAIARGGEAAIARKALDLLSARGTQGWVAGARQRLADRSRLLYWTSRLLPETAGFLTSGEPLRVNPRDVRWTLGERALWATLWWDDEFYAFGLDWRQIRDSLKDRAARSVGYDEPLNAFLLAPGDAQPDEELHRKNLEPWLPGWAMVIIPKDDPGRQTARERQRWLSAGAVVLALITTVVGVGFTVRLVNRELELAQMKTRFAANVSHELRSPITQIRLKGEALMLGLADTPEEAEQYYRAIVRESERLSRLVDDVLDYAVLPSGRHNLAPRIRLGNLGDTVRRALDSVRASDEVRRMELDVHIPDDLPPVPHDTDAVVRCVINLVLNAAKYSKESNWIGVRARQVEAAVEISVSDRGIGIHPNDLQRIFEPYFRSSDPRVGTRKGVGLGLTITQEIMKAHGGRVDAHSRQGKGTTFTLRFPLNSARAEGRRSLPAKQATSGV